MRALQSSSTINRLSVPSKGFSDHDFAEESRTSCSDVGLLGLKMSLFLIMKRITCVLLIASTNPQFTAVSAHHLIGRMTEALVFH